MASARYWLKAWRRVADLRPGEAMFRAVDKLDRVTPNRITATWIYHTIKARVHEYALAVGISDEVAIAMSKACSGHSLRRGYCTSADAAGVPE